MNLIIADDFPAMAHDTIVRRLTAGGSSPRVAWMAADTATGHAGFSAACVSFSAMGLTSIEYCDIDEERDEVQLAYLHEFDIVCLADGDPLRFRYNLLRSGASGRIRQCLAAGCVVVAIGGGALVLTPNVSSWRLQDESPEAVLETHGRYHALSAVAYELMPHLDAADPPVLERLRQYSEHLDHDIIGLSRGAAVLAATAHAFDYVGGITRIRRGVVEAYRTQ